MAEIDLTAWQPTPKNQLIRASRASNRLRVGGTGSSKALHVDTPIPTPQGWRRIRDLAIGDHVFDESGAVCRVTGITETMMHPSLRLEFDTGDELIADLGHQWHTFTFRERRQLSRRDDEHRANRQATRRRKGQAQTPAQIAYHRSRRKNPPKGNVWTTAEIAETLMDRDHTNHAIRLCGAIQMPDADLPIDPYVLGLWLGDGTTTTGIITTADPEVIEEIRKTGRRVVKTSSPYAWRVVGLTTELSALYGIPLHRWNRKCIPDVYMRGSIEQRLALLQGLMDADGCADQRAGCGFANTNRELINAVFELAVSLGIKATVQESRAVCNGKDCGPSWRVAWTSSLPVFRLSRKLSRLNDERRTYTQDFRYIVAAEDVGIQPVCCISVDSPSHLYLAGRAMIPTHNSSDALMEVVQNYLCYWDGLSALWIRRNWGDLEKSTVRDLEEFVPGQLYEYNKANHVARFYNGSTLTFGHLQHNSEADLAQYLSASFPVIVIDECGQISGTAYQWLQSRNRMNPECKPDTKGRFPRPVMLCCTNPVGPYWPWYKAQFVEKRPFEPPEGARRDRNGLWWIQHGGEWVCVYDPADWEYVHSTLLDNNHLRQRDPGLYNRLMGLPNDLREKLLFGNLDSVSGQYFDVWEPSSHVIDLRLTPDAIRWQPWQPKWIGWDAGRAHYSAAYWMTKADVKHPLTGAWKTKTVVYRERVERGKDHAWWANELARLSVNRWDGWDRDNKRVEIGEREKIDAIFYSHEQFSLRMEAHTPAEEVSRLLAARGMPGVSRGTRDRSASAQFCYNMLSRHEIVILSECPELIRALPSLMRDEDNPEDVAKREDSDTSQKADDCYDGFRHGLYGMLGTRATPHEEKARRHAETIDDPVAKWFYVAKQQREKKQPEIIVPSYRPLWMSEE